MRSEISAGSGAVLARAAAVVQSGVLGLATWRVDHFIRPTPATHQFILSSIYKREEFELLHHSLNSVAKRGPNYRYPIKISTPSRMAEKTLTRDLHTFEKLDDLDHSIAKERERGSFPCSAVDKKPRDGDGDDDMRSADVAAVEQAAWPIMRMLEETTINRVIGDYQKDVRLVKEDTKLSDALSILAQERMLSLPVQAKDSVDVIGFVDVLDVLTHIVRLCSEGKTHPEADEAFENTIMMYQKGFNFASTPVSAIIDSSSRDPLVPVYGRGTLAQLIEEAFSRGVHRVPVYNRASTVVTNIISQSDIIKFIMGKMDEAGNPEAVLGSLMGKTVDELRLGTKPVVSMSGDLPAFKALQL
ncbi:CBS domain containing protein, partial [Acanthamoeba castellanii str. Neff]